jgi:V/A-type H+-transporting ATPase subunit K
MMDPLWQQILTKYFLQSGLGFAMIGAAAVFSLGGIGSAKGIRISASQAGGVLSEQPELFGKLLVIMALPGTQGFYSLITAILIGMWSGLFGGKVTLHPMQGIAIMAIGIATGMVEWLSAIYQGETSAAAINLVAKKPDSSGRAILLPALVETYALLGLLSAIVLLLFVTNGSLVIG